MKATWNGAVIAESDDTVAVEGNTYFPEAALNREFVVASNHRSSCSWKGQAHYYSLLVNGDLNPDAVWYYPEPLEAAAEIKGRVAFWKGVDVEGTDNPKLSSFAAPEGRSVPLGRPGGD